MLTRARSWFVTVGLSLIAVCHSSGQDSTDRAPGARLETEIQALAGQHGVVGMQIAVGVDGAIAWTGSFGMADLEHDSKVTDATLFRTASVSKWMTATAALRLVELRQLNLDAPVQEYCSKYPEKQWKLTTRHLLGHRGGIRAYWGANGEPHETPKEQMMLRRRITTEQLTSTMRHTDVLTPLEQFKANPLQFEPGTEFRYTSLGYRLVGCVIRGAAGSSYADAMQKHVFGPAGMSRTRNDDAYAIIRGRARGYSLTPGGELRRSRFQDVSGNLPAGGHLSTASDLVRFALAWNSGKLVNESSKKAMMTPPDGTEDLEEFYGLGVGVRREGGHLLLSHSGGQAGASVRLTLNVDTGRVIAWMVNSDAVDPIEFDVLVRSAVNRILDGSK